jgi:hypothetical protein
MRRVWLEVRTPQECRSVACGTELGVSGTAQWARVLDANLDAGRHMCLRVERTSATHRPPRAHARALLQDGGPMSGGAHARTSSVTARTVRAVPVE